MSNLGDLIVNAIAEYYPVDITGVGHTNEAPFVLFRFMKEDYKIGYKGTIQYRLIALTSKQINEMFNKMKEILEYKTFGKYQIRKIEYTVPQAVEWTDLRWFQDYTVTIIYEEV